MSELQAAVERLRRVSGGEPKALVYRTDTVPNVLHAYDEHTLAQSYLAEHPEDESDPVTERWIQSIGFKEDDEPMQPARSLWHIGELMYRPHYFGDFMPRWQFGPSTVPNQNTRGDVRRLMSALGIDLKSQPEPPR